MQDNDPLAEWLKVFQGIDQPEALSDPTRSPEGIAQLVQNHIDMASFDTEPDSFPRALEELAPKDLRNG